MKSTYTSGQEKKSGLTDYPVNLINNSISWQHLSQSGCLVTRIRQLVNH